MSTHPQVSAHFLIVSYLPQISLIMTFKDLLHSKKFWTLISAIVSALAAFFLVSCSAQAKVARTGVHIDTVRIDYIIRSNNFTLP